VLDSIREVLITVQQPTLAQPQIVKTAQSAHERILARIEAGDGDGARRAMREHLAEARRGMERVVRRREAIADGPA
jgi:DNA-binding FadR family transcriptional regulator